MKKGKIKIWHILVCLLVAAALYIALYYSLVMALQNYETGTVVIASMDIPENVEITEENYAMYFTTMEMEAIKIPESAFKTAGALNGTYVTNDIDKGAIITRSMVDVMDNYTESYKDAKIVTVSTSDLEQSVAGTLRAGDIIDIYSVDTTEVSEGKRYKATLLDEGVSIIRSYDASGVAIKKDDTTSIAQIVLIPMASGDVEGFLEGLEKGSIKLVKHIE